MMTEFRCWSIEIKLDWCWKVLKFKGCLMILS